MTLKREEYIRYRFKRAEESLEDALILIERKRWNTAIILFMLLCSNCLAP
jgi:uncharacterized protein (UPF0332 family)